MLQREKERENTRHGQVGAKQLEVQAVAFVIVLSVSSQDKVKCQPIKGDHAGAPSQCAGQS